MRLAAQRPVLRMWLKRIGLALTGLLGLSLVGGWFMPLPSTLMLGRWITFQPVTRLWRPLEQISPHLVRGVIAAEDQKFCAHFGVDLDALRSVLASRNGPSRGASTITMQVVKNVYLWPGRSYLRKALEIPLAIIVNAAWSKRRVMEIYLNIAEWGDGLYGAEAAAQRYFRKAARDLSPSEAARLVAALPNPARLRLAKASPASHRILGRMSSVDGLMGCLK